MGLGRPLAAHLPQYPVTVLNLPSVVESYKTLDDVNLVKTTDIGQVRGVLGRSWGRVVGRVRWQLQSTDIGQVRGARCWTG